MKLTNIIKIQVITILISIFTINTVYCQTTEDIIKIFQKKKKADIKDTLLITGASLAYKPKMGKLVDSISIEGSSFKIKPGETFKMDKLGIEQKAGWVNPSANFSKSFKYSDGEPVKIVITRQVPEYENVVVKETKTVYGKEVTKETPTRRVKGYKSVPEIFYGLLEFNKVHEACSSDPATRAYFISIPEKYLAAARGGNISVVYEYYTCEPFKKKGKNNYTTWVLWLSDIEFTK
jgi:hypothetical protein